MSCCSVSILGDAATEAAPWHARLLRVEELARSGRPLPDGSVRYALSVPEVASAADVARIEAALGGLAGVRTARVNLTNRRIYATLATREASPAVLLDALEGLEIAATPIDMSDADDGASDSEAGRLLRATAVAGFAAANIMLLSVSIWSGADGATRDLFHLISALIAVPAVFYAGQPFFRSALAALAGGRTNMDVPISIGVLLVLALSLFETARHGPHAYFDAAVGLLFFLLIGRYLERLMRDRARSAVSRLANLSARACTVIEASGQVTALPVDEVRPGMIIMVASGERLPVDAAVEGNAATVDLGIVTGEARPVTVANGGTIAAGALNVGQPVTVRASATADNSFLAEMTRLMRTAEETKTGVAELADRIAGWYAPFVHALAALTFVGWVAAGAGWHSALMTAVAVLIITCPCALGLAVPIARVMGVRALMNHGIIVRNGSAFERIETADRAVFDKTGTLTTGEAELADDRVLDDEALALAAGLAAASRHPIALAVTKAAKRRGLAPDRLTDITETPGAGLEGTLGSRRVRLGRHDWATAISSAAAVSTPRGDASGATLAVENGITVELVVREEPRPGAAGALAALGELGLSPQIASGDRRGAVEALARRIGLDLSAVYAEMTPRQKLAHLADLHSPGHAVVMIGDGLNDAPALAAADVSIAPGNATDVGKLSADFVFLSPSLDAIPRIVTVSRRVMRLVRQNLAIAMIYNLIAIPLAVAGLVTPLIAAVSMSASSIIVIANALRLRAPKAEPDASPSPGGAMPGPIEVAA